MPLTSRHQHEREILGAQSRADARMFTLGLLKGVLNHSTLPSRDLVHSQFAPLIVKSKRKKEKANRTRH